MLKKFHNGRILFLSASSGRRREQYVREVLYSSHPPLMMAFPGRESLRVSKTDMLLWAGGGTIDSWNRVQRLKIFTSVPARTAFKSCWNYSKEKKEVGISIYWLHHTHKITKIANNSELLKCLVLKLPEPEIHTHTHTHTFREPKERTKKKHLARKLIITRI